MSCRNTSIRREIFPSPDFGRFSKLRGCEKAVPRAVRLQSEVRRGQLQAFVKFKQGNTLTRARSCVTM